jgi:transposase
MSLQAHPLDPIPELTQQLARASFPKGTVAMNLRDALGSIYHDEDFAQVFPKRGRGAEAPWRLALVTVLQTAENLSDVQAAEMVRGRIDWKYALSLSMDDTGFDASILTDFRQRLIDHQAADLILEPILEVCREHGWLKRGGGQVRIDSTIVLGNVRRLSSLETVGETIRVTLNELSELNEEWVVSVVSEDWFDRYVHRFELQRFPKGKQAQEELMKHVGEDANFLIQAACREGTPQEVREHPRMTLLKQVWDQHFESIEGKGIKWRDGPLVANNERIVTPHDEEARESTKRDVDWLGYKVHITETCEKDEVVHLIKNVETTRATEQDAEETEALIEAEIKRGDPPRDVFLDASYMSGKHLVTYEKRGIRLIGPVLPDPSAQEKAGYGLRVFEIDWDKKEATCPKGETSKYWYERGKEGERETILIKFPEKTCQACEAKEKCTKSQKGGRALTVSPREIHEATQRRRAEQGGKAFQETYAQRAGIEGTISEGVRAHGMRRSRYRGQEKTHFQMVSVASAINLIRIYEMLKREEVGLPPRRKRAASPFARLRERVVA